MPLTPCTPSRYHVVVAQLAQYDGFLAPRILRDEEATRETHFLEDRAIAGNAGA